MLKQKEIIVARYWFGKSVMADDANINWFPITVPKGLSNTKQCCDLQQLGGHRQGCPGAASTDTVSDIEIKQWEGQEAEWHKMTACCPQPELFDFPYSSQMSKGTNQQIAEQALRKIMFANPKQLVPHIKGTGWPTCVHDGTVQLVIRSSIEDDFDTGRKIVQAWIECPECHK